MANTTLKSRLRNFVAIPLIGLTALATSGCYDAFYGSNGVTSDSKPKELASQRQFEDDFKQNYAITSTNGSQRPFQAALGRILETKKHPYTIDNIYPKSIRDKQNTSGKIIIFEDKGYLIDISSLLYQSPQNPCSGYLMQDTTSGSGDLAYHFNVNGVK